MQKISIRSMVKASFFAGLSIILTRITSIMVTPTLRLGLGELPLMISGIVLGPVVGGATGFVADMVGFMINPQGIFHLGFTISSVLWGVLPGIIEGFLNKDRDLVKMSSFPSNLIIVIITRVLIAVILNTYWLSHLMGKAYIILLSERVVFSLVQIPLETYIISRVIEYLRPALKFE